MNTFNSVLFLQCGHQPLDMISPSLTENDCAQTSYKNMPNLIVDFANNSCGILFRRAPFHIIDLSMLRQRVRQRQMHMPLQQM